MKEEQRVRRFASGPSARAFLDKAPPLKIVGVCSDIPSRLLATGLLLDLAHQCATVCEFNAVWWSFKMLENPRARQAAIQVGADADMIWCAANAWEDLPGTVRAWMASCAARRKESECALVGLLRSPSDYPIEQSPSRAYFCRLARAAGLELFVGRFGCDGRAFVKLATRPCFKNNGFPPKKDLTSVRSAKESTME